MTDVPDHWCLVPALRNLTTKDRKMLSIPHKVDRNSFEKCTRYSVNWSDLIKTSLPLEANINWSREPCLDGYEYDTSEVTSSVVIDFNLVCDYDVYPTLGLVALNVGGPIGVYTFGLLNDRIGRKKSFFICLTTLLIGSILTALAYEYWIWVLARIIVGLTIPAIYQIPFIISLELAGPNYRSFVTVMTCIFYTLGLILLSGISYLLRDWRSLALATSVPFFFYYLYWFVLPESPRWLLMKERLNEANSVLKNIAEVNGEVLPEEFTLKLEKLLIAQKKKEFKETKNISVFALCRTPNMRCSDGNSNLVFDIQMLYICIFPNNISLCWRIVSDRIERYWYWHICIHRRPRIDYNTFYKLLVMGVVSVIGGLTALRLPETLHCPLPQTAEEGEEFGKNWTYKDCLLCGEKRQTANVESYENLDQLELIQAPLGDEVASASALRRPSMHKLVRQVSTLETQRDLDGTMKMTYWF
ncbi:carcinine transporter isoform X2 [Achroia grisella]|uniref:carcinine transporter isoform X2 n=1 Tax=Achroia grisella TaxID=688607 RepID=UPI0027D29495|nr:carcinine transporter isoform X2 [Achroia grisella]